MTLRKSFIIIPLFFFLSVEAASSLHIPSFGTLDPATCPGNQKTPSMTWQECFEKGNVSIIQVAKRTPEPTAPRDLLNGEVLTKEDPLLVAQYSIRVRSLNPLEIECSDAFIPLSASCVGDATASDAPSTFSLSSKSILPCDTVTTLPESKEGTSSRRAQKKAEKTAAYQLKRQKRADAKALVAAAKLQEEQEKKTREEAYYSLIITACEQRNYEAALTTLALCDKTKEKYPALLFSITESTFTHPFPDISGRLLPLITELVQQKPRIITKERASYFLLYLSSRGDPAKKRTYLQEAADLQDVIARVQLLALQVKDHLENPDAPHCKEGEDCIHKQGARFLNRHATTETLKPLLATYLLSLLSVKSGCPNIELPSLDDLYEVAERSLTADDYAYLLTIFPRPSTKQAKHTLSHTVHIAEPFPVGDVVDMTALIASAMSAASHSLTESASMEGATTSSSSHSFGLPLYKIFTGFTEMDKEFKEKIKTARGPHKKLLETLSGRKEKELQKTLLDLVETVKNTPEVRQFMKDLENFEKHSSYGKVKNIIDSYLQKSLLPTQTLWRPYLVLPQRHMFRSLAPCPVPGSFPIRCDAFRTELDLYMATAPLEEEVFKIIEDIIISFIRTSKAEVEIQSFLDIFKSSRYFYFYITGTFHKLKKAKDLKLKELAPRFKENLTTRITQAQRDNCPLPIVTYLEKIVGEIESFIQASVAAAETAQSESLPSDTDYADPTKNKFLLKVDEQLHSSSTPEETIAAFFNEITHLTAQEAPYFMYAMKTRAASLLPPLQKMVLSSDTLNETVKTVLITGFKRLLGENSHE
jgi:hypothetical protein